MRLSVLRFSSLFFTLYVMPVWAADTLNGHSVQLDSGGKLISWIQPQDKAYDRVLRKAWDFLLNTVPAESNGLKTYYTYCCMDMSSMHGTAWPHNPAEVNATLADSAAAYYAYSGDRRVVELVRDLLDYQLAHGTTPSHWPWASVPYASSDHGAVEYRGAHDFKYDARQPGRGDGYGVIEPDKVGELGYGYLEFYMLTGVTRFREAALACANALARHVQAGDAEHSPWPFRVYAETNVIREEYTSSLTPTIRLLDTLVRLNLGDVPAYLRARKMAWDWLIAYPMQNNNWSGHFEDVPIVEKHDNLNQIAPMETARYLMDHADTNPVWRTQVIRLIEFVEKTFIHVEVPHEPGVQWGANAVSEQVLDWNKMGSHTSRYASINARWYELTGDAGAKEKAFRSFNWASYMCRENGFVNVGPIDQSLWFTDGYGDYIRHFLSGMASVPEWTSAKENHLLRSSSIVTSVSYLPAEVSYQTFDQESTEVLRLNFVPVSIFADGKPLKSQKDLHEVGWSYDAADHVLRIYHDSSRTIRIQGKSGI